MNEASIYLDGVKTLMPGFDPSRHRTKAAAAMAAHEALRILCRRLGQDPATEVFLNTPSKTFELQGFKSWWLTWESGPDRWAVASFISGPWGFCETQYGFDLIFTD